MRYQVKHGDTPASIAARHGVRSMNAMFRANPHKPLVMNGGRHTWRALGLGEQINVPIGVGYLGANATIRNGSRGADVTLWQTIIGVKADGIFGPNTEKATRAWQSAHGLTADGIVGPKTWGAALASAAPPVASLPSLPGIPSLPISIPGLPISIPRPSAPPVAVTPIPAVTAPIASAAVAALSAIDPCFSGNVSMVCAAQAALGLTVDGKYGPATADAVKRALGNAPAPCATQAWWGAKGQSKCGGASIPSLPIPAPALPPPSVFSPEPTPFIPSPVSMPAPPVSMPSPTPIAVSPSPSSPQAPGAQPIVVAPEAKKGLSTGAMVAGAVGVAAIVGLIAVAASGKRPSSSRTTTIRRAPAKRRKASKKRK